MKSINKYNTAEIFLTLIISYQDKIYAVEEQKQM